MPSDEGAGAAPAAGRGGSAGLSVRAQLALAVVATTAGAVLLLWASTRQWVVEVAQRPAPLPPVRTVHTGTDIVPWLPALALIALAGAGALVATRAAGRVAVSALLAVLGAGSVLGAGYGLLAARRLEPSAGVGWPLVGAVGAAVVAAAGWYALRRCRSWPTMGSRYETPTSRAGGPAGAAHDQVSGSDPATPDPAVAGSRGSRARRRQVTAEDDPARLWDALDEGHDPTDR